MELKIKVHQKLKSLKNNLISLPSEKLKSFSIRLHYCKRKCNLKSQLDVVFWKEVCNILYCLEVSWAIENLDAKIFRCKIMQSQMSIPFLEYIPIIHEIIQKSSALKARIASYNYWNSWWLYGNDIKSNVSFKNTWNNIFILFLLNWIQASINKDFVFLRELILINISECAFKLLRWLLNNRFVH